MKHAAQFAIIGSLLLSVGTACSSSDSPSTSAGGSSSMGGGSNTGSSTTVQSCPSFEKVSNEINLTADSAHNYSFKSEMHLATQSVAEKSKLTFNWSAVTKDMYGRPLDPKADVKSVLISIWHYGKDDLESKLNNDELEMGNMVGAGFFLNSGEATQATTDDLTSDGEMKLTDSIKEKYFSAESLPASEYTYLLMLKHNDQLSGKEGRMVTTFTLSTDSNAETSVKVDNSSTTLTYQADFSKLSPTLVPAGASNILIDWSDITTNSLGHEFKVMNITNVLIASYDLSTSELQENLKFIDLKTIAVDMWQSNADDITLPKLSWSKLKDSAGNAFKGIDSTHTWVLALECGTCMNPAPWYIAVLQPCKQ
jgi:hypothetical protein